VALKLEKAIKKLKKELKKKLIEQPTKTILLTLDALMAKGGVVN